MQSKGILVAAPQMIDVFFAKTVVLLCDYNEEGALGIVINRTTNLDPIQVLDQMEVEDGGGIRGPVLWGGPVQPGAVFLTYSQAELEKSEQESNDDEPVFQVAPGLRVSPSREVIRVIASDQDNAGAFLSLGYAGWGAGQLDDEIRSGSWIFIDVSEADIFATPTEELYDHCLASLGIAAGQLWMHPVNE